MPNVEYLFEAALRALCDAAAAGEALGLHEKPVEVAEGHRGADSVAAENLNEVVAMLHGSDDRQAGAKIVDRL